MAEGLGKMLPDATCGWKHEYKDHPEQSPGTGLLLKMDFHLGFFEKRQPEGSPRRAAPVQADYYKNEMKFIGVLAVCIILMALHFREW